MGCTWRHLVTTCVLIHWKKSLKIPKGKSESVNRRRTDNTMAKRKSTNNDQQNTYKTKDRVTRTPLKTGDDIRCSGRVSSSCSTSDTRRVNLVTYTVISHKRGKDREVFTSGTYPWSFVTQIFHNGQPSHGGFRASRLKKLRQRLWCSLLRNCKLCWTLPG